jgi:hypothetical protein
MLRAAVVIAGVVVLAVVAGCAKRSAADSAAADGPGAATRWGGPGEPGLEVVVWSTDAEQAAFAAALAPYIQPGAAPGGLSPESLAFLSAHGMYLVQVPVSDLENLRIALGAPPRHMNQWLGQAVVWTEAATGPEQPRGQTIALESERLRLTAGRLRLLARSWIAPVPVSAAPSGAAMTIELLPQHDEEGRPKSRDSLVAPSSIAATDEGMLFTRLLVRLAVRSSDSAFVLVGLPPGSDIQALARAAPEGVPVRAITDGEAGAMPGVGQVVRQPPGGATPSVGYETGGNDATPATPEIGPVGPPATQLPTLGEAMLSPPVWVTPRRAGGGTPADADSRPVRTTPRRQVVVFVPRLPERLQLLP